MTVVSSLAKTLNFHILLEPTETGQIAASIAELVNCRVEANTRQEALVSIQKLVQERLSQVEVLPLDIALEEPSPENPWTEFIGMFEEDEDFAEISAQMRTEREQDTDLV